MTTGEIREALWVLAGGRCAMCHAFCPLEGDIYTRAHIHHDHKKGEISLDTGNGEVLCYRCHIDGVHGDRKPQFGGGK